MGSETLETVDCLILGGGAAGLFCGARTAARGRDTVVLERSAKPAEKIRISGGGRCNFTNSGTTAKHFISENKHFAKSALARYTPSDFCDLMQKHNLSWTEKKLGQLFCDQKSGAVIQMLLDELETAGGDLRLNSEISGIRKQGDLFVIDLGNTSIAGKSLIVATGGLSIPKMGATGLAYEIARSFGHTIVAPRPALVPFAFTGRAKEEFAALSGVSVDVQAKASNGPCFRENLLFTHRGLSGPSMLQVSSYWREGEAIEIDLLPRGDELDALKQLRATYPARTLQVTLSSLLPGRLAGLLADAFPELFKKPMGEISNTELSKLQDQLKSWRVKPAGTEGWRTAEVTAGGIDTKDLSSKTMESTLHKGLFFIGECVDVTGWLGGYNFQWAWASAAAAAEVA